MERYFVLDNTNTYLDWNLLITSKEITPPELNTNYVEIGGMSGSLDLSEALTGEITYKDCTISASFWTDHGSRNDRAVLIQNITRTLHGRKIKIIEPDDPNHYMIGRVKIGQYENVIAYSTINMEFICEPWKYAIAESERIVSCDATRRIECVINNNGIKTLCPDVVVTGDITLSVGDDSIVLTTGKYKLSDLKLYRGANIVGVYGFGTVRFIYREADLIV